jgi:hypothetical protein
MNSAIELHDSKVSSVKRDGSVVCIALEQAYIHRSSGRPGIDAGEGYVQAVDLVLSGVATLEEEGKCLGTISDGSITVGEQEFANVLPLPFGLNGRVSAKFAFVSGGVLAISATEVACVLMGVARYVEAYEG